jgi:hypothetical protein
LRTFTSLALALIMETNGRNSVSCDNFQSALLETSLIDVHYLVLNYQSISLHACKERVMCQQFSFEKHESQEVMFFCRDTLIGLYLGEL